MDDLKDILQQCGKNVEDVGRMLQRKPPLTLDDLTELQETLLMSAETINTVIDTHLITYAVRKLVST